MRPFVSRILLSVTIIIGLMQDVRAAGINSESGLALPIGAGAGGPTIVITPSLPGVSGNVGIGTTTPAAMLEVNGTAQLDSSLAVYGGAGVSGAFAVNGTASFSSPVGIRMAPTTSALSVNGEADVTTLTIGDSGALSSLSAATLLSLQGASCGANQALSETTAGVISCVNIIDLTDIGTFPVPTCTAGQALTWTGRDTGFACVAMPVPPPSNPPIPDQTCPEGQAFTIFSSGEPACGTITVPPTPPVCNSAGYGLQFDGTNYSCVQIGLGASCPPANYGFFSLPSAADRDTVGVTYTDAAGGEYQAFQCQNGAWIPVVFVGQGGFGP